MKNIIRRLFACALVLCLVLAFAPPVAALTRQQQYYLVRLAPGTMPRSSVSYPARLIFNVAAASIQANVTFTGTCGVNASITDDEMLALLTAALSGESSYKALQDACDDKELVSALTEKLKFSQEDMDDILGNLRRIFGVDELWDVLQGKLPEFGADDAVNAVIDGSMGDNPLSPIPSIHGMIISGVFVSYDEFQKDQERYKDIIALSQANERLRRFNAALSSGIRKAMVEGGDWSIVMNSRDVSDYTFYQMPAAAKLIWTADIDLKKTDGGFSSIGGTYSGTFKISMDADWSNFDNNFDDFHAQSLSGAGVSWGPVANEGPPSEMWLSYEIPDCRLNLSLPAGVNRHFFEESIPSTSLVQTEFHVKVERTIKVDNNFDTWEGLYIVEDNGVWVLDQVLPGDGVILPLIYHNPIDSGNEPWPPDTRSGVTMTLVIDMLAG